MGERAVSFLDDEQVKLLLFGGKGGAGKTTAAAAAAVYRAVRRPDRTILLVSTDPAHSLSDSFDQSIGDEIRPINGMPNLLAWELNAEQRLEDFRRRQETVLTTIMDRGTYFDREDIGNFLHLSLPGLDELVAIFEIADLVRGGTYDLVILDTAPTGHTLRLLAMPQQMDDWLRVLNLMLEKHRYMLSVFGRPSVVGLLVERQPDDADDFLRAMAANLDALRRLLGDPNTTEFVPVTIPEAMSIEETARLLEELNRFRVPVRTVVINRVMGRSACSCCEARREGQQRRLAEINHRFAAWARVLVPLLPLEVRGKAALTSYIQMMLNPQDAPLPGCSPHSSYPAAEGIGFRQDRCGGRRISLGPQQFIFFGGKGGVGKTTAAAATAIHLARSNPGKKILLFSADPAHSLSDSLGQQVGSRITPTAGVDGLFALEMDAAERLAELKHDYRETISDLFASLLTDSLDAPYDRGVMEELIAITPPGLDELMGLSSIIDLMREEEFDHYVVDLAPTGHALRFLETPGVVRQWFMTLHRFFLKYRSVTPFGRVEDLLISNSKRLRQLQQLLGDPERCQLVIVTTLELMAVQETKRLWHRLQELSVPCRWVIANMVLPRAECAFCAAIRGAQQRQLEELRALAPALMQVRLFPREIRGIEALTAFGKTLYGEKLNVNVVN